MLEDTESLGEFTRTSIESYWIGFGLTWRFGRGACGPIAAPICWCANGFLGSATTGASEQIPRYASPERR